jgi:hypothetical protein
MIAELIIYMNSLNNKLAFRLVHRKITVKLAFGVTQTITAFAAIVLALLAEFNVFDIQSLANIPTDNLHFYVFTLLALGFVFAVGGLFLVYDWWESR